MGGGAITTRMQAELEGMRQAGTFKHLRTLTGATGPHVEVEGAGDILLLCANNYLGLAAHPEVIAGGQKALARYGAGPASVRFICGTLDIHRELEEALARWLGQERALLYGSCWNANEGVIPALVGEGDVILSDALNHASIIDACRLVRGAERQVYGHADMDDLEARLRAAAHRRGRVIVTDGVFSMEGDLAPLAAITELARRYDALVVVDDSHGHGVLGRTGRGTAEHCGVAVDVVTGTLGKALGGASGGFVAGSAILIEYLIQRSRPQLFSNALPPAVAGSALAALGILEREPERVARLQENAGFLRAGLTQLGLAPLPGPSAIIPVIVGETARAIAWSERLFQEGVYVVGFGYPVVPEGAARLRLQVSAAHTPQDLERALAAFARLRAAG